MLGHGRPWIVHIHHPLEAAPRPTFPPLSNRFNVFCEGGAEPEHVQRTAVLPLQDGRRAPAHRPLPQHLRRGNVQDVRLAPEAGPVSQPSPPPHTLC